MAGLHGPDLWRPLAGPSSFSGSGDCSGKGVLPDGGFQVRIWHWPAQPGKTGRHRPSAASAARADRGARNLRPREGRPPHGRAARTVAGPLRATGGGTNGRRTDHKTIRAQEAPENSAIFYSKDEFENNEAPAGRPPARRCGSQEAAGASAAWGLSASAPRRLIRALCEAHARVSRDTPTIGLCISKRVGLSQWIGITEWIGMSKRIGTSKGSFG